jgi:hypothetical protein|tara:strand:+ start:19439 stop:19825 length:387 start_codon:yes stop_codon:yes gene_type:complete
MKINIPISHGELIDKLTILTIKLQKITDVVKIKNIQIEYDFLNNIYELLIKEDPNIKDYFNELISINMKLWEIEDNIRKLEKIQKFDSEFIKLARDVYKTNDKRFDLKNQINGLFNSTIKEQKSYEEY